MRRTVGLVAVAMALTVVLSSTAQAQDMKTIKPGMTQAEVVAAWGDYLTARKAGNMLYMYYKNDCMKRCGTYDVVFLENGQVVDAVVRDSHRAYDGVASSPKDRKPEPTVH
ncbi:MAG TPA: hypothetical protein VG692_16810 [Gemmatimonadales bacterium]|nr:hypothetical protein [Gemmatimonadales bacterium]